MMLRVKSTARYKTEKESYQNLCDKSGAVKETRSIDGVQRECISYKGEWRDNRKADVLTTWYTVEKNVSKAEVSRAFPTAISKA